MINTISGRPIWTSINAVPKKYSWLSQNETCEVAIIGGGVTGAMCAMKFAHEGIDTILMEGGAIGSGYTASFPGILSCEFDETLYELGKKRGTDEALQAYELCASAIQNIEELCAEFPQDVGFCRRDLLRFSTEECKSYDMRQEYLIRHHNGYSVDLLEGREAREKFSFEIQNGIYAFNQAAELDPFLFTHALATSAESQKARIYENTSVDCISRSGKDLVIRSRTGYTVRAKKIIVASGFETADYMNGLNPQFSTVFSLATIPIHDFSGWYNRCIIACDDCHSVMLRTTADNRMLISGLESILLDAGGKLGGLLNMPNLLVKKYTELESTLTTMFPAIRNIRSEYLFASSYQMAADGFPLIGEHPDSEDYYFALCAGHNGIVYAEIASRMLLTKYSGHEPEYSDLFKPNR